MSRVSSVGVALVASWVLYSPTAHAQGAVEIVFASGPEDSGSVQRMVDAFNARNEGRIHVTWKPMPADHDAHRTAVVGALQSGRGELDVVATDVVWTAELARNRWVVDVTDRLHRDFERSSFLEPALDSTSYRLRSWGVPWYTDAGVLFYRKDLLAGQGITEPPATWDALAAQARAVQQAGEATHGFVFQGAAYEGGAVNASEFVWSAGGDVMVSRPQVTGLVVNSVREVDVVEIDSPEAAAGFDRARQLIVDGIAPEEVVTWREQEALDAFAAGDVVFMRGWPYAYRVLLERGFTADQVGMAPLPGTPDGRQAGSLGGWNLMIAGSATPAERDASWAFIRFLTDPAQQRQHAREAGDLPVLGALYEDAELVAQVPAMGLGKELFARQLGTRPKSPFYAEMSSVISTAFQRTLKGELSGAEAVEQLDRELRGIAIRNR